MNIWMEGYVATGGRSDATLIGSYPHARNFDEAIKLYKEDNPETTIDKYTRNSFTSEEAYLNRRSDHKIWGCALFDNEKDARKAFG